MSHIPPAMIEKMPNVDLGWSIRPASSAVDVGCQALDLVSVGGAEGGTRENKHHQESWRSLVTQTTPHSRCHLPTRQEHPEERSGWALPGVTLLSKQHYGPGIYSILLFSRKVGLKRQVVVCHFTIQWLGWISPRIFNHCFPRSPGLGCAGVRWGAYPAPQQSPAAALQPGVPTKGTWYLGPPGAPHLSSPGPTGT